MNRPSVVTAILVAAALSSAGSFWFGFREGAAAAFLVAWPPRAFISLRNIEWIRDEKTKNALSFLESDVDSGLMWAMTLDDYPLKDFLEPVWGISVTGSEKYLVQLADYRKNHKSPLSAGLLSASPLTSS